MKKLSAYVTVVAVASILVGPFASTAESQRDLHLSATAGIGRFAFPRPAYTWVAALRGEVPIAGPVRGEGGFTVMRAPRVLGPSDAEIRTTDTFLVPEAMLQLQLHSGSVRPYVGIGVGVFWAVVKYAIVPAATSLSVATGVRVEPPGKRLGLRTELHARQVGFSGNSIEWTAGVFWKK